MAISATEETIGAGSYNNSRRYGAEDQEVFSPTFIEELAEAHSE